MENELKPCPFRGQAAQIKRVPHIPRGFDYIPQCIDTACAGRLTKLFPSREIAVYRWNRRAKYGKR